MEAEFKKTSNTKAYNWWQLHTNFEHIFGFIHANCKYEKNGKRILNKNTVSIQSSMGSLVHEYKAWQLSRQRRLPNV